jgi:hypothetical protein
MALQPAQLNGIQAKAIYSLTNMERAVEVAEGRVQQATNEVFSKMQTALNQSEINNRTLAERNASLNGENLALNQHIHELTLAKEAQVKALEEQNKAILIQFKELQDKMSKLEQNFDMFKNKFENHYHGYTGSRMCAGIFHPTPGNTGKPLQ